MTNRQEHADESAARDAGSTPDPGAAGDAKRPDPKTAAPPGTTAPGSAAPGSVDDRLRRSPLSPNELDATDESQKAADVTRAGQQRTR